MKAGAAAAGGLATLGLLLVMEAGIPVPLPADLVMFTVGERVAAGAFPLWLAVAGFEVVAIIGTTVLFVACRGPAHRVIARFGPRVGLSQARVGRATAFVETRGRFALAAGRGTPGLRTLTVVAAGASGLSGRRALPALILGSSVFLQLHLVLGLLLGPLADRVFNQAKGPALVGLAVLLVGALIFWRVRRGKRAGTEAWTEAACPACIGLALAAGHLPGLASRTEPGASPAGHGDDPQAMVS
jgi:membrane protein DedA with SNARE-associated domain